MGLVVVERQGIDDAAAGKGQSRLLLEEGDVLGLPETERVIAAVKQAGIQQRDHVAGLDRAIGNTATRRFHLDQGFQPVHAARTVAHDRGIEAACADRLGHGLGNLLRTERYRRGIARDVDLGRHRRAS